MVWKGGRSARTSNSHWIVSRLSPTPSERVSQQETREREDIDLSRTSDGIEGKGGRPRHCVSHKSNRIETRLECVSTWDFGCAGIHGSAGGNRNSLEWGCGKK
jgi:hypothetical protein